MIQGVSSLRPVVIPNIAELKSASSRIAVPVKPTFTPYARFKHIIGVPHDGEGGISVYKLLILDNLIDQFRSDKRGNTVGPFAAQELSSENLESTIQRLFTDLKSISAGATPYRTVMMPEPGVVLDLVA